MCLRKVPLKIEIRAGIAFISDHPVTSERVVELLRKNRIDKSHRIEIAPHEQFVQTYGDGDSRPRGSGRKLASILKENGYTGVIVRVKKEIHF